MKKKLLMTLIVIALFLSEMREQNARLISQTRASFSTHTEYNPKSHPHSEPKNRIYVSNGVMAYGQINNTPIDMSKYTGVATLVTMTILT